MKMDKLVLWSLWKMFSQFLWICAAERCYSHVAKEHQAPTLFHSHQSWIQIPTGTMKVEERRSVNYYILFSHHFNLIVSDSVRDTITSTVHNDV